MRRPTRSRWANVIIESVIVFLVALVLLAFCFGLFIMAVYLGEYGGIR